MYSAHATENYFLSKSLNVEHDLSERRQRADRFEACERWAPTIFLSYRNLDDFIVGLIKVYRCIDKF